MAGLKIDVSFQTEQLRRELASLKSDLADRVAVQALNRAITGVRTEAVRELRKTFSLPASSLRKRLRLTKATRARLTATIFVRNDFDPPLSLFKPRWKQRQRGGATVQPSKERGRIAVPGGFTALTRYGRIGVFRREGKGRYPLVFLRSSDVGWPTIAKALLEAPVQAALSRTGRARFVTEARRLAARRLGVAGGRLVVR